MIASVVNPSRGYLRLLVLTIRTGGQIEHTWKCVGRPYELINVILRNRNKLRRQINVGHLTRDGKERKKIILNPRNEIFAQWNRRNPLAAGLI